MGRSYDHWADDLDEDASGLHIQDLGEYTLAYDPAIEEAYLVSDIAVNLAGIN